MTDNSRRKILERLHVIHNTASTMTEYHDKVKTNAIANYGKLFTFFIRNTVKASIKRLNELTIQDVEDCTLVRYDGEIKFKYSEYEFKILEDGTSPIVGSFGKDEFQKIIQDVLDNGIESMYDDSLLIKELYLIVILLFIVHLEAFGCYEELSAIREYLIGIYVYTKTNSLDERDIKIDVFNGVIYNDGEFILLNTLNIGELNNVEEILIKSMGNEKYEELWNNYLISSNRTKTNLNDRLKETIKKEVKSINDYGLAIDNIDKLLSISIDDVAMCDGHHSNLIFVAGLLDNSLSNKSLITIELFGHLVEKLDGYYDDCAVDGGNDNFDILFHGIYKYVVRRKFNLPTIELSKPLVDDEVHLDALTVDSISMLGIFLANFRDQEIFKKVEEIDEGTDELLTIDEILDIVTKYKLNFDECKNELGSVKELVDSIDGLDFSRIEGYLEDAVDSFNSVGFPIRSEMMVEKLLEDIEGKEAKDKYLSSLIWRFNRPNIY